MFCAKKNTIFELVWVTNNTNLFWIIDDFGYHEVRS